MTMEAGSQCEDVHDTGAAFCFAQPMAVPGDDGPLSSDVTVGMAVWPASAGGVRYDLAFARGTGGIERFMLDAGLVAPGQDAPGHPHRSERHPKARDGLLGICRTHFPGAALTAVIEFLLGDRRVVVPDWLLEKKSGFVHMLETAHRLSDLEPTWTYVALSDRVEELAPLSSKNAVQEAIRQRSVRSCSRGSRAAEDALWAMGMLRNALAEGEHARRSHAKAADMAKPPAS